MASSVQNPLCVVGTMLVGRESFKSTGSRRRSLAARETVAQQQATDGTNEPILYNPSPASTSSAYDYLCFSPVPLIGN